MSLIKFEETIEHLKTRWKHTDRNFLRQLFPLLADGRPIPLTHLAEITHKDIAAVEQELVKGYTGRDSNGGVIELFGVTLTPTLHRIQLGQVCLFSCCALVAHMVPLILDRTATIESVDPVSHRLVRLQVSPSGVQSLNHNTQSELWWPPLKSRCLRMFARRFVSMSATSLTREPPKNLSPQTQDAISWI